MASYPNGMAYVGTTFEDQQGYLTLSFEIAAENPDYFSCYIDSTDREDHGANIYFTPDGYLAYCDESGLHYVRTFSVNTWYRIKMEIDIPANTYDIYVDDSMVAHGAHFRYFGQTTHLNRINFGRNSWEMPIGFIDDISIFREERKAPITTVTTLTGSLDYLLQEDVHIRLDALVKDAKTMVAISNASVTLEIYYPNGSLWVSEKMFEILNGTGIYEWESNETIQQMNLEKGVYLACAQASITDDLPSTDIVLFHVDPPSGSPLTAPSIEFYYGALMIALAAALIIGIVILRRQQTRPCKTRNELIDTQ
jgi:hypothetical protein